MEDFIKKFKVKSRHHSKLINFIYPELKKIKNCDILEFGVSEKGMSTELFLNYSKINNCKLYSVDNVDYSKKFNNTNWNFIFSRDDNYKFVENNLSKNFDLILLDTLHERDHVKKIIYNYYKFLNVGKCFFIDDISWLPYVKSGEKNRFYAEINNKETFEMLLDLYFFNRENIRIDFTFEGTGICKITKLNNNSLNNIKKKVSLREYSIKNIIRKLSKFKNIFFYPINIKFISIIIGIKSDIVIFFKIFFYL